MNKNELTEIRNSLEKLHNNMLFGGYMEEQEPLVCMIGGIVEMLNGIISYVPVEADQQEATIKLQAHTLRRIVPALCDKCGKSVLDAARILLGDGAEKPQPQPVVSQAPSAAKVEEAVPPAQPAIQAEKAEIEERKPVVKEAPVETQEFPEKKRGRPKGSKNKPKPEPSQPQVNPKPVRSPKDLKALRSLRRMIEEDQGQRRSKEEDDDGGSEEE